MGSYFLTTVNVLLALYCVAAFIKMIVQFGLPNHPARFMLYLVTLSVTAYFSLKAATGLGLIAPVYYLQWRSFPLVAGSIGLLLQIITILGQMGIFQQKIFSRMPLLGGLIVFSFFSMYADVLVAISLILSTLFLTVSVGKARYQKRMFFKMVLFLSLFGLCTLVNQYWVYALGELFLLPALFYFFIFQKTFGITAMVDEFQAESSGALS